MRVFGYFLHKQKVTRAWAGEAQEPSNRIVLVRDKNVSPPPARRWANLGPSVPFAGTGEAKRGVGPKAPQIIQRSKIRASDQVSPPPRQAASSSSSASGGAFQARPQPAVISRGTGISRPGSPCSPLYFSAAKASDVVEKVTTRAGCFCRMAVSGLDDQVSPGQPLHNGVHVGHG